MHTRISEDRKRKIEGEDVSRQALALALKRAEEKVRHLAEREKQHKLAQGELEKRTHELNERIEELNCLYVISAIVERGGTTLDEIMQKTVDIVPDAWQYPDIATCRIVLGDRVFVSHGFRDTRWKQS